MSGIRRFGLAVAVLLLGGASAAAQEVRLIVPFAAGGPMDNTARILAPAIEERLGETVIVDARPGAGGVIGTEIAASAAPDGKTIILSSIGSHVLSSLLRLEDLTYDPIGDFTPLSVVGNGPHVLVANNNLEADTLDELFELARSRTVTFGSAGIGSLPHLGGELLNQVGEVEMVHVPYPGIGPALVDILGGHVDLAVAALPTALPQIRAGELKAIAFLDQERSEQLPDLATSVEQGYPDLVVVNTYYVLAPAGLSDEVLETLETAVVGAGSNEDVVAALDASGIIGPASGSDVAAEQLRSEFDLWGPLVEELDLTIE